MSSRFAMVALHRLASERGSASLEFVTAGILLLVPLVYLVLTLAQLQAATFAAEGAARQATRVFVTASTITAARAQAQIAIEDALADVHLQPAQALTTFTCRPNPSDCLAARSWVTTRVSVSVPLLFVPAVFNLDRYARVQLSAEATQRVAR